MLDHNIIFTLGFAFVGVVWWIIKDEDEQS